MLVHACEHRDELEIKLWTLTDLLSERASRLLRLIKKDPAEFLRTRAECKEIRLELIQIRGSLQLHRSEHGC